jgi:tRNA nucleotidyltransferase (CCA-adding enzyme)
VAPAAPPRVPDEPARVLDQLWRGGHAAYLVGGGIRDALLGRSETDWDVATDARPERLLELFPEGRYENRFGTVIIRGVEVTTFRRDHVYGDHRRPDTVTFTDNLDEDLLRRDFTVNAIAWGRPGDAEGQATIEPRWVDPTGGMADLGARQLRAVGAPARRFDEDSLRLLRAARLAAQLGFDIEPATRAAMRESAHLIGWVSSERAGDELRRMIAADPPSVGFRILEETGLLAGLLPDLSAQKGIEQDKIAGHDLWDHTLATLDAAARVDPPNQRLRLAALLHDIGKPVTFADGRFIGHDTEGARMAGELLTRLAFPRRETEAIGRLVRHHMFHYQPNWTGAAVRRFIRRVGRDIVDDLLALRQADNVGSGRPAGSGGLDELRRRLDAELAAGTPLSLAELAINGDDLVNELGLRPGPLVGRLLERLLDSVVTDPERNSRELLLADARAWARELGAEPGAR